MWTATACWWLPAGCLWRDPAAAWDSPCRAVLLLPSSAGTGHSQGLWGSRLPGCGALEVPELPGHQDHGDASSLEQELTASIPGWTKQSLQLPGTRAGRAEDGESDSGPAELTLPCASLPAVPWGGRGAQLTPQAAPAVPCLAERPMVVAILPLSQRPSCPKGQGLGANPTSGHQGGRFGIPPCCPCWSPVAEWHFLVPVSHS